MIVLGGILISGAFAMLLWFAYQEGKSAGRVQAHLDIQEEGLHRERDRLMAGIVEAELSRREDGVWQAPFYVEGGAAHWLPLSEWKARRREAAEEASGEVTCSHCKAPQMDGT